jgi:hypothetical protein
MARGLSLILHIVQPKSGPNGAELLATAITDAVGAVSPNILHYAWAVDLTTVVKWEPPVGLDIKTMLLTTVYDLDFYDYIAELVTANPAGFNFAAKSILGIQDLVPVEQQPNLNKFIDFVRANDLNSGGDNPSFYQNYTYTCDQIQNCFSGGGSAESSQ